MKLSKCWKLRQYRYVVKPRKSMAEVMLQMVAVVLEHVVVLVG
jgi:hypothetical protein